MNLAPVLKHRFFDSNGVPLAGGLLYSYVAGTTTPLTTYSNATGTTNANPVVLDSSGYADVWLDPTLAYKFVLKDSGGATIYTVDNVTFATGISAWNANSIYQQGQLVTDSSGQGLLYVSLTNNNQNQPLTNVSAWRVFGGNIRTVSANTTLAITDDLIRSNSTSGSLTHTLPACSTTPIGKRIVIKDIGSGSYSTSIKGSGSDNVDGSNTYSTALAQYGGIAVENNGSSWDVLYVSGGVESVRTVSANTTLLVSDGLVRSDSTSGNITITLPACATAQVGKRITVKDVGTSTYATTVKGSGTDTIDGSNTFATTLLRRQAVTFENNGASWDAQGKIASIGQQISSSSSSFSTSSGTYVDVTNLSVTITTTGRPVVLFLMPDGTSSSGQIETPSTGGTVTLKMVRGASDIAVFFFTSVSGGGSAGLSLPPGMIQFIDASPAAGTYTYKVQVKTTAATCFVTNCKLAAYEL